MVFNSSLFQSRQNWAELQATAKRNNTANNVQVLLVKVNEQIFGLLMSQLYNILRIDSAEPRILRQTTLNGKPCTVVEHRSQFVPVLSLSKVLLLNKPLPVDQSEILLSGKLTGNNYLAQVFGLSVDSVLTVHAFKKEDLRYLPKWLCQERLGNIIIGALLAKPEIISADSNELGIIQHDITPVTTIIEEESRRKADHKAEIYNRYVMQSQQKAEQDNRRPIILLNLDTIRLQLYGE
jgi:chemotaxis signal transduction protein